MTDVVQSLLFDIPPAERGKPGPKGPTGKRSEAVKARANARREARAARDEAVARGERNANPDWLAEAERAILKVAAKGEEFTTDAVWPILAGANVKTGDPRALGGVMTGLAKRGEIVPLAKFVATTRKSRHAAPIRVWQKKAT